MPASNTDAQMLQRVGKRVSDAAAKYCRSHGAAKRVNFKWEFNLVNDNTPNAFCMPGGKVVFFTGILPITQSETGMAVVMAHEIAHAIANHGNERMSQGLAAQFGGMALNVALSQRPQETRNLFLQAYDVGSTLGVLRFSRLHESEADKMGLMFMAMAGYDPSEASSFWTRMSSLSGGQQPPQFLSTHPSHDTRIADIRKWLPEAMKYYNSSPNKTAAPANPAPNNNNQASPTKNNTTPTKRP